MVEALISFSRISPILVMLVNLPLGLIVLFNNPRNRLNFFYFLLSLCISVFAFSCFIQGVTRDVALATKFDQILYFAAICVTNVYALFTEEFTRISRRKLIIYALPITIFLIVANLLPFFRLDVLLRFDNRFVIQPNWGWYIFFVYFNLIFIVSFLDLVKSFRDKSLDNWRQIKYFFLGSFLAVFGLLFYYLLIPNFTNNIVFSVFNLLSSAFSVIFGLFMSFNILFFKFLDIEVVIKRSTYFLALLLVVIFPSVLFVNYILEVFHFASTFQKLIISGALWTIIVLSSDFIQQYLKRITDHLFFKADYNFDKIVEECSKTLLEVTDFKMLLFFLEEEVHKILKTNRFGIFIRNKKDKSFSLLNTANFQDVLDNQRQSLPQTVIQLSDDSLLVQRLLDGEKNVIFLEDLKKEYKATRNQQVDEAITLMAALDSELLVASVHNKEIKGVVVLGAKKSGDRYNSKDIRLLTYIVNQESLVISKLFEIEDKAMMMLEKDWSDKYQRELETKNNQLEVAMNDLKIAQDKLIEEEQLAAMGNLAGEVAHDIRNPLSSMNRLIQYLVDNGVVNNNETLLVELFQDSSDDPEAQEKIKLLLSNNIDLKQTFIEIIDINHKLRKIANDFLEYSKTSKDIPTDKIDMNDLVSNIVADYIPYAKEHKIILINDLTATQKIVMFPQQIERITRNIMDNGLKAIEDLEVVGDRKLSVRLWDDGKWIRLEIKDSGIGMDADHLSKIFKPFYTKRKNLQGTGLGLAIVKKIIDEAKGTIQVASILGEGTTFTISIPAVA